MKRIRYSYYSWTIVLLLLATAMTLPSCNSDEITQENEGKGFIILSLNGLKTRGTRGAALFSGDEEITKVRVLVFHGPILEVNKLFSAGDAAFSNPFLLEVVTGKKDVYVIANENSTALSTKLSSVNSRNELFAVLADEISAPVALPLPMTGETINVTVDKPKSSGIKNEVTVKLHRIVAKITLKFKKKNNTDNVKITKVSLLRNAAKSTLYPTPPAPAVSAQTYWTFAKQLAAPFVLNTTLQSIAEVGDIYVYENLTNGDKTKATQIEVEALYNDIISTYRVYVNENITTPGSGTPGQPVSSITNPDDHLFSIKRGYQYIIKGTIGKVGEHDALELQSEVLPWTLFQSEFNYAKVNPVFTVAPTPPTNTPVEITATQSTIDYTFNITAPDGGTWSAKLTNTDDFELVKNDSEFFTWGKISTSGTSPKIRIKAKANAADGSQTELIVRVNGAEIDFNKNGFTGSGQRLVIVKKP